MLNSLAQLYGGTYGGTWGVACASAHTQRYAEAHSKAVWYTMSGCVPVPLADIDAKAEPEVPPSAVAPPSSCSGL